MKILLIAWPRTGSKTVHENLVRYTEAYLQTKVNDIGVGYDFLNRPCNINDRLEILDTMEHFVAKVHPNEVLYTYAELQKMASHFDYTLLLDRDRFDQETSRLVANRTGIFSKRDGCLEGVLANVDDYKFEANLEDFKRRVTKPRYTNPVHHSLINSHTISFEDVMKVKDAKDFCKLLQLEYVNFDYFEGYVEYAENKKVMITNYQELLSWYKEQK